MKYSGISLLVAAGLLVSGCGSSPDPKYYTLNPVLRTAPDAAESRPAESVSVKIGPVTIPEALDQSRIVTRTGANQLEIAEYHRWGGDLQSEVQRILGENISVLLPTNRITLNQEVSYQPEDFQVIVNIREFSGRLGEVVILNADWTVVKRGEKRQVFAGKTVLQETAAPGYSGFVDAQTKLLEKLSDEMVAEIKRHLTRH